MDTEPVEIDIDGTLDLHHFSPRDLKHLIPDYLAECRKKGITEVRIVHGKGRGVLRRTVHSLLANLPVVQSFRLAPEDRGGWGATLVFLQATVKK
ncbi:MAG: Smr/MutS family protein [Desulfofustis sp.]|nr:Smr/MutS family protein [Desulfofustis sp.]